MDIGRGVFWEDLPLKVTFEQRLDILEGISGYSKESVWSRQRVHNRETKRNVPKKGQEGLPVWSEVSEWRMVDNQMGN